MGNKIQIIILGLIIACLILLQGFAQAAEYYLDADNGSDDNPGTSDAPWQTLAKAQATVTSGDTAYFKNGNYGAFIDQSSHPGRTGWIMYKAVAGHHPQLTYINMNNNAAAYNAYICFDGFTIRPPSTEEGAVKLGDISYVRLYNLKIYRSATYDASSTAYGIFDHDPVYHLEVNNCLISADESKTGYVDGFVIGMKLYDSDYLTITNNEVKQCWGIGIEVNAKHVTVSGNNIHHYSANAGLFVGGGADGIIIENNLIHDTICYSPTLAETPTQTTWSADGKTMTNPNATWGVDSTMPWVDNLEIWIWNADHWVDNDVEIAVVTPTQITLKTSIGTSPSNVTYEFVHREHVDTLQVYGVVSNMIVRKNKFYDLHGNQLMIVESLGGTNNTYENNLFIGDISTEEKEYSSVVDLNGEYGDMVFRNNTIIGRCGVMRYNNTVFINNIISYIQIRTEADHANTFTQLDYNIYNRGGKPAQGGPHDIYLDGALNDPTFTGIFKNYPTDLTPASSSSLAVGHGDPTNSPATDILGNPRDANPDAGCYEYGSSAPSNATGDINGDGSIDAIDLQLLINMILAGNYDSKADLNSDSSIDAVDLQRLVNIILG